MNRRRFSRLGAVALGGLALPGGLRYLPDGADQVAGATGRVARGMRRSGDETRSAPRQELRVDEDRLIQRMRALEAFGRNDAGGIDRVAFSDANIEALDWVAGHLGTAGFEVGVDLAGNLIARKAGRDSSLPPLMFGSHIDSVPGGGNFDGQVGSMAALEAATRLAEAGHRTRHSLEVAIFSNEEGGKTGSRVLAGEFERSELDIETASGYTIGEGLRRLGGDPDRLADARREPGSIAAFLELHIEQGAVMETDGVDIGVVEGIVGIMRWNVTVEGMTNHAGTTPMDRRQDAMVGAARFIDMVHRTARGMPGRQVATVGRLAAEPGAPNVIPGRVVLSLEIRDLSMEGIERVFQAVRARSERIARDTGVTFAFERFYTSRAAPTDPRIRDLFEASARDLGLASRRMPSGAGHDAQSIALLAPVGMIFVPSIGGISHAPNERTEDSDIVNGANVLLLTLLNLDEEGLER